MQLASTVTPLAAFTTLPDLRLVVRVFENGVALKMVDFSGLNLPNIVVG